jgi:hypothetical protein
MSIRLALSVVKLNLEQTNFFIETKTVLMGCALTAQAVVNLGQGNTLGITLSKIGYVSKIGG